MPNHSPNINTNAVTAPRFAGNENVARNDTQLASIRRHLEAGKTLTQMEALKAFSCFRLAARIDELKGSGMPIESRPVSVINAEGKRVRVAQYRLKVAGVVA
jgi:hypothetical protein